MRILVTGGAGYIGSHVCKALALEGYEPIVYDNLSLGHDWAVKWGPLVVGNIRDEKRLIETCERFSPVGVIHLAALSNVRESEKKPLAYYQNNVAGTLTLLHVLEQFSIEAFVFSSTCAVYGIPNSTPIDEYHPKAPISPYGKSKLMTEMSLEGLSQISTMNIGILRYFNAAGADPDGEIGEAHDPETHLIPLLIQTAQGKKMDFTLLGNDHETDDGTAIRDFIHVTDLARAHVQTLNTLRKRKKNLTLNLGTGQGYSVLEVIEKAKQVTASPISVKRKERCQGDPPCLVASVEKAKAALNWTPIHSDLMTILETAAQWHGKR